MLRRLFAFGLFTTATSSALAADATDAITGYSPVTISAANYRTTSRKDLIKAVERADPAINPDAPASKPLTKPLRYVMIRGEAFTSDVSYAEITALLATAFAKKGYINAVDAQERIYQPETVSLVLRVNYGTLFWRLPTVRTDDLTYGDGMVARARHGSIQAHGGESNWDQRAGGNDGIFAALEANEAAPSLGGVGGGGDLANGGSSKAPTGPILSTLPNFGSTREYHVIVVDAFDYRELKKDGVLATRLWSTFVAAPRRSNDEKFSKLAATLVRSAMPYFGETARGLQVFPDVGVKVNIGEMIEVKTDAKK